MTTFLCDASISFCRDLLLMSFLFIAWLFFFLNFVMSQIFGINQELLQHS